jgi:hypothetical protein
MALSEKQTKNVHAIMIFEAIGRPAEYLGQILQNLVEKIKEEEGVKILESKINSPQQMKDHKDFFSNFAEVEVEVEEIRYLTMLMFKYMPAHVDVISPEEIVLSNNGWSEILSELTRRLHGYDEIARVMQNERAILEQKLKQILSEKEGKSKESPEKEKKAPKKKSSTKKK